MWGQHWAHYSALCAVPKIAVAGNVGVRTRAPSVQRRATLRGCLPGSGATLQALGSLPWGRLSPGPLPPLPGPVWGAALRPGHPVLPLFSLLQPRPQTQSFPLFPSGSPTWRRVTACPVSQDKGARTRVYTSTPPHGHSDLLSGPCPLPPASCPPPYTAAGLPVTQDGALGKAGPASPWLRVSPSALFRRPSAWGLLALSHLPGQPTCADPAHWTQVPQGSGVHWANAGVRHYHP